MVNAIFAATGKRLRSVPIRTEALGRARLTSPSDRWPRLGGLLIDRRPSPTISPISSIRAPHMKTTIELPDDLLERGKALARRENSTLKALIEEGLRRVLRERARAGKQTAPFAVQPFHGDGLSPEFADAGWERIRDEIYRDRG